MAPFVLVFCIALLPGVGGFLYLRGPTVDLEPQPARPDISLPEAAVLLDGAVGATRWAFAAILCRLARDGHCTLTRTRKRRWLASGPAITVDPHPDPTRLSVTEQTIHRQLLRHDALGGFRFAGSTFRRRTLRDVRADLVERGWLLDRRALSNTFIMLSLALFACAWYVITGGLGALPPTLFSGLATGSLLAAHVRHPRTRQGARHRAAHRSYAEQTVRRIWKYSTENPEHATNLLLENLPCLILERWATPQRLRALANQFEAANVDVDAPDWIRSEEDANPCIASFYRDLAAVLSAMGARTPLQDKLRAWIGVVPSRS